MISTQDKVLKLLRSKKPGWTFSAKDLLRLAPRSTIDWVLYRLVQDGTIRRAVRGVYYVPKTGKLIKEPLPPDIYKVAEALARKFGWAIQPSGLTALNFLGLSTQIPAAYIFQSSGPDKTYQVGRARLEFLHAPLKEAEFQLEESTLIVRALQALGQEQIDQEVLDKLRKWLDPDKRKRVLEDTQRVTGWIYEAIRKICREDG